MPTNNRIQRSISLRFRRLLSGAPDGTPPWLDVVAGGDDSGLFLPTDAPWVIHGDFGTLVGGIRALLMQALHPGALAGVSTHSRYETDPLGRLSGTIRWLTVTTFAGRTAVEREAQRVNRLHDRVAGTYETSEGSTVEYRAADEDLLLWVHVAFMESFLVAHEWYSATPIPTGDAPTPADNYVRQWAASVAPLGLATTPQTRAEVDDIVREFWERGVLRVTDDTRRVVRFIERPPLPAVAAAIYRVFFAAAVVSLRPEFQRALRLTAPPRWLIIPSARVILRVLRIAVGPESPIEQAARDRLARLGLLVDGSTPRS